MIRIGTSGFRGIDEKDINERVVYKIGLATLSIIRKRNLRREVFVGYDFRKNSLKYSQILVNLLSKNGILCHFLKGGVTSSMISFLSRAENLDLSIMVTSSHNPYSYNGVKIFSKGGQDLNSEMEDDYNEEVQKLEKFEDFVVDDRPSSADLHQSYYEKKYINSLVKNVQIDKNLNVAFDTMHGSSKGLANKLLKKLGINGKVIDSMKMAKKIFTAPIPSRENLYLHKDLISQNSLDFTFATDGDGDRMAFVFDDGTYHDASDVAPLLYYFASSVKGNKGGLVCNYSFPTLGKIVCDNLGKEFIESKIGFKNIGEKLISHNALVGCENSSMAYAPHTPYKDGLICFVMMCELVSYYKQPISKIMADFKQKMQFFNNYCEISYHFEEKNLVNAIYNNGDKTVLSHINMSEFTPKIDGEKFIKMENLDGYKYFFSKSFVLIRQSGTEKVLRFVVESDKDALSVGEKIKNQFQIFVKEQIEFVE